MIKKLVLPLELSILMTEYAENILKDPSAFIDNKRTKNFNSKINQYDDSIPGVSDTFINNHNLSMIEWDGKTLETCLYSNLTYISLPPVSITAKLVTFIENEISVRLVTPTGNFLYPIGGYMGWHTNSNSPGIRVYAVYTPIDNGSYFKYVDTTSTEPTIITDWDTVGWNIRIFDIHSDNGEYLWHCVGAPSAPRISFGYKFTRI